MLIANCLDSQVLIIVLLISGGQKNGHFEGFRVASLDIPTLG